MLEEKNLQVIQPGRFQILEVNENISIKNFVLKNNLNFKVGRGFYEFTKTETIQAKKEIILMNQFTGELFTGKATRKIIGLPIGISTRTKPKTLEKHLIFIQSTSANRKLIEKTLFLYEVKDWHSFNQIKINFDYIPLS